MERVLYGESRIPARVLFLKPLSAAIAIGTGGPFGAEEPIIATGDTLLEAREWIAGEGAGGTHQGFPVLSAEGVLLGVLTRRDLFDPARDLSHTVWATISRPPVVVFEDSTLRDAADLMVREGVGRLPVIE